MNFSSELSFRHFPLIFASVSAYASLREEILFFLIVKKV